MLQRSLVCASSSVLRGRFAAPKDEGVGSHAAPSEGLPDADIDRYRPGAGVPLERKGDVEANGADGRIVSQAETHRREQRLVEGREVRGEGVADVEEWNDADRIGHLHPQFRPRVEHTAPANPRAPENGGAALVIGVAAD